MTTDDWSRRDWLKATALGLAAGVKVSAASAGPIAPIRACILVFYYGGPSHIDTWDMKPDAPREVRGEFRPIATNVPGISVCEHMPRTARVVDRLAIVRGVHHPMTNHNAAAFAALGGRPPAKGDLELLAVDRNDPPCLGSTLSRSLPGSGGMPAFVALPHVMRNVVKLPGQAAGFLGSAHEPFQVEGDPNAAGFRVEGLAMPDGVDPDRLARREALRRVGASEPADAFRDRAVGLLGAEPIRRAFRVDSEPAAVRESYGRTTLGQSLLLARRLVESGVRFVAVYDQRRPADPRFQQLDMPHLVRAARPHRRRPVAVVLDGPHRPAGPERRPCAVQQQRGLPGAEFQHARHRAFAQAAQDQVHQPVVGRRADRVEHVFDPAGAQVAQEQVAIDRLHRRAGAVVDRRHPTRRAECPPQRAEHD